MIFHGKIPKDPRVVGEITRIIYSDGYPLKEIESYWYQYNDEEHRESYTSTHFILPDGSTWTYPLNGIAVNIANIINTIKHGIVRDSRYLSSMIMYMRDKAKDTGRWELQGAYLGYAEELEKLRQAALRVEAVRDRQAAIEAEREKARQAEVARQAKIESLGIKPIKYYLDGAFGSFREEIGFGFKNDAVREANRLSLDIINGWIQRDYASYVNILLSGNISQPMVDTYRPIANELKAIARGLLITLRKERLWIGLKKGQVSEIRKSDTELQYETAYIERRKWTQPLETIIKVGTLAAGVVGVTHLLGTVVTGVPTVTAAEAAGIAAKAVVTEAKSDAEQLAEEQQAGLAAAGEAVAALPEAKVVSLEEGLPFSPYYIIGGVIVAIVIVFLIIKFRRR